MNLSEPFDSFLGLPIFFIISLAVGALLLLMFLVVLPVYFWLTNEPADLCKKFKQIATNADHHSPLLKISAYLNWISDVVGQTIAWLVVAMASMQFTVVVLRYVFSWGAIKMQESIWYMHGMIFTFCAGYTLLKERHVRIDVFYGSFSEYQKAIVNAFGSVLFIFPVCYITWFFGFSYVANAWKVMEGSTEGTGLHYVYLLKTSILIFAILLALQGLSLLCSSLHTILTTAQNNRKGLASS